MPIRGANRYRSASRLTARTRTQYFPFIGGLDVVTPALSINPGAALTMVNFEPWYNGGYRRIDGFERFDGRPKPSAATFIGFNIDTVAGLSLGDTVTGDTSGATGVVCGIYDDDGSFGSDVLAVTKVTGTFQNGETLNTSAYTIGSAPTELYAPTNTLEDTYLLAAEDEYRDDIQKVPGEGEVRGIWQRNANVYAIRNNVGSTAGVVHKASASGWTTSGITMAEYIYFDAGGGGAARALPAEGDTVTGGTSGATATVHRVISHGGATASNDEYGYLVLTSVSGTFQDNEKLQVGGTDRADADGANVAFAFSANGNYRFLNHNFFAGSSTYRTYGVNGVDPAFEIDENDIISPILFPKDSISGQPATNDPFLIEEHKNALFFALPGGTFANAVVGEPLTINGFLGAAKYGVGDEITGMQSVVGTVLVVTTERETRGLFGDPATIGTAELDLDLRLIGEKTGGKLNSVEKIDTVYGLDDLGITSIDRTDAFGDFVGATVSRLVQPLVTSLKDQLNDSTIVRETNQYRIYFDNGDCLIMYAPAGDQNRKIEFGFAQYPSAVKRIYNSDDENGTERTYFATDDGYVYEDRIGKNFDGEAIASYVRLAFNQVGSPSYRKRFRRADLELSSQKPLTLRFISDLSYGSSELSSGVADITVGDVQQINIFAGGGFWDTDNWDEFFWDGQSISTARANITGTGENIGFLIFNESAVSRPFILQGLSLHYEVRRLQR